MEIEMPREAFVFTPEMYEAAQELPPRERRMVYEAVIEYGVRGNWDEDLDGPELAVYWEMVDDLYVIEDWESPGSAQDGLQGS